MFATLQELTEKQEPAVSTGQRVLRYLGLLVVSIVVFAGLYMAIRLIE